MTTSKTKPSRRVRALVKRVLRDKHRGAFFYDRAAQALQKAISAGLMEGQEVEVETFDEATGEKKTRSFELINNFAGEKAYRNATIPKFELRKIPKFKRSPVAAAVSAAPTAEASL